MQDFPHKYTAAAQATTTGDVRLMTPRCPPIATATPAEFGGPGDRWSPEALLVSAVADCFVLTFRGIAARSGLAWESVTCDVVGTLEKVDRVVQFTSFDLRAHVRVPPGINEDLVLRVLNRAEQTCLITNSLKGAAHLEARVEMVETAAV